MVRCHSIARLLLATLCALLIFTLPTTAVIQAQSELSVEQTVDATPAAAASDEATYTVVAGDTLFIIAQRFGISLEALIEYNQITNPDLLEVGQVLRIPSASATQSGDSALAAIPTRVAYARPGDTIATLSQRLAQDTAVVTSLNGMVAAQRLFPGQPVFLPAATFPNPKLSFGAISDITLPPQLVQGRTQWLWVATNRPLSVAASWNGLPIPLTPVDSLGLRQYALLPVPALLQPGLYPVTISYEARNGYTLSRTWSVEVIEGDYESQEINLPPDRGGLLDPALIQAELEKVMAVWSQNSPQLLWSQPFTSPISSEYPTTSPFGTRRSYNGGPYTSYHEGQDFGVPAGVPVAAPGHGVIALAEPLHVRGNAVIIDHGRGIFTGYWHLSESTVVPGQEVQTGDIIGISGNTGLSTGAHLHWELRIYTIAVDPMQFLAEPLLSAPAPSGATFNIQNAGP